MEKEKDPTCPSCGSRLEYASDQHGACDWRCARCGWRQHVLGVPRPPYTTRAIHCRNHFSLCPL